MKSDVRRAVIWTRRVLALAGVLALTGYAPIAAAGSQHRHPRPKPVPFQGAWIFQSSQRLAAAPNPARCGEGLQLLVGIRGVDNLGGIYNAELDYCVQPTDTGLAFSDVKQTTTYESGDTTEIVCEPMTALRDLEQCTQTYSKTRCVFVGGTGSFDGIRGYAVMRGVESGSPCDGSGDVENSNDAGAFWTQGAAYLP